MAQKITVSTEQTMHLHPEDLHLYVLGRLLPDKARTVESHVSGCDFCNDGLTDAAVFVRDLSRLTVGHEDSRERRQEHRIPTDDPASIRMISPFSIAIIEVRILDASKNGLKVRTPERLSRGTIIQVHMKCDIILGEVRHCTKRGENFEAGIAIYDSISRKET